MPFGAFKDWEDCVSKIKSKNPKYSDDVVDKVCGKLKHELEKATEEQAHNLVSRALESEFINSKPSPSKEDLKEIAPVVKAWEFDPKEILSSKRKVTGTFHIPKIDKDKEIITKAAMSNAIPDYMHLPILHDYHKERVLGLVTKVWEESDAFHFEALFKATPDVDDAWEKAQRGIYDHVSIYGSRLSGNDSCKMNPELRSTPCISDKIRLDSISACDDGARNDGTSMVVAKGNNYKTQNIESFLIDGEDIFIKAIDSSSGLVHGTYDGVKRDGVRRKDMEKCGCEVKKMRVKEVSEKDEDYEDKEEMEKGTLDENRAGRGHLKESDRRLEANEEIHREGRYNPDHYSKAEDGVYKALMKAINSIFGKSDIEKGEDKSKIGYNKNDEKIEDKKFETEESEEEEESTGDEEKKATRAQSATSRESKMKQRLPQAGKRAKDPIGYMKADEPEIDKAEEEKPKRFHKGSFTHQSGTSEGLQETRSHPSNRSGRPRFAQKTNDTGRVIRQNMSKADDEEQKAFAHYGRGAGQGSTSANAIHEGRAQNKKELNRLSPGRTESAMEGMRNLHKGKEEDNDKETLKEEKEEHEKKEKEEVERKAFSRAGRMITALSPEGHKRSTTTERAEHAEHSTRKEMKKADTMTEDKVETTEEIVKAELTNEMTDEQFVTEIVKANIKTLPNTEEIVKAALEKQSSEIMKALDEKFKTFEERLKKVEDSPIQKAAVVITEKPVGRRSNKEAIKHITGGT